MILIDFNQTLISNLMSQISTNPSAELSETLIRHMVLTTILSYKRKFSEKYGQMVFCADDRKYWRKEFFPYYKANRKKARDASKHDWTLIFNTLNKIRDEIKEKFPYVVIQAEGAEADDVIATMCKYTQSAGQEDVLILSGDKDFLQLQKYRNVKQYSPMLKKYLIEDHPQNRLLEHILCGDSGDGVPNFLSNDAVFITDGQRQKPIRKERLKEWILCGDPEKFCDQTTLKNFKRNQMLIDLDNVPDTIAEKIVEQFQKGPSGEKKKLLNYFIENRLKYLMESISEF